jgi:5-(carboxyamino)imidazole ribonucleotide synthase
MASAGHGKRPVKVLGVLGGGQLGRMLVHAAQVLGLRTVVLDPDLSSPAGLVSHEHLIALYDDAAALARMAQLCDVITTEFENVPAHALATLAAQRPVSPSAGAVSICQHRVREKAHFVGSGVPCVPFKAIEADADLAAVSPALFPGILKTSTLGYDGKGQALVDNAAELGLAWRAMNGVDCILEQRVDLRCEFSVIVARDASGHCVHLPVQQNLHRGGILAVTQVPAPDVPAAAAAQAIGHALAIAESLAYVGVLCVEFFLLADGSVLANEMAPRPHNSGHYSIDACDVSQFDLQVRATAGWPLVTPRQHSPAVMLNLLGDLWFRDGSALPVSPPWEALLRIPGAHLHLYGKPDARRGRKMGHLTLTASDAPTARSRALQAAQILGLPAF